MQPKRHATLTLEEDEHFPTVDPADQRIQYARYMLYQMPANDEQEIEQEDDNAGRQQGENEVNVDLHQDRNQQGRQMRDVSENEEVQNIQQFVEILQDDTDQDVLNDPYFWENAQHGQYLFQNYLNG